MWALAPERFSENHALTHVPARSPSDGAGPCRQPALRQLLSTTHVEDVNHLEQPLT